ncbi:MAG: hypothetical protein QOJ06_393 [Pseudonocardiales bacterium]|jgi:hypothetical protein|nr:hypothetical protein [Pseudonocardiales bacterium]HZE01418.1 hypothetical protein [Pseudonocardiaceae bacterium]
MNTLISKLPWVSRLQSRPIPLLIGVVALLLAVVCGVIALVSRGSVSGAVDTHEVVNAAGQYRFDAPTGWSTTQQGRITTVTSPDQATVITLGVGRPGPIPVAGTLFFQQVAANYHDVQVIPPEAKQVGPQPALIYGGIGNNANNTQIRFLAITVQNDPTNYGIAVFTAAASDPAVVLPPVNQVVESFRALPAK